MDWRKIREDLTQGLATIQPALAVVTPILVVYPTAYMSYWHLVTVFGMDPLSAFLSALGVEFVVQNSVSSALNALQSILKNQTDTKGRKLVGYAMVVVSTLLAFGAIAIIMAVNVIPEAWGTTYAGVTKDIRVWMTVALVSLGFLSAAITAANTVGANMEIARRPAVKEAKPIEDKPKPESSITWNAVHQWLDVENVKENGTVTSVFHWKIKDRADFRAMMKAGVSPRPKIVDLMNALIAKKSTAYEWMKEFDGQ